MQNKHFKKLCLLKSSVYVWVCATLQLPAAGPKKTADPLELKLQGAVTLAVDAGNKPQVLWKHSMCS